MGGVSRYLKGPLLEDLAKKAVFLGGPRQVGKTTLALNLAPPRHRYLNWDVLEDREFILKERFPPEKFIIFDEVHKFKNWRNYIKGLYDTRKETTKLLVTGSARLDYYRHSGDSLQGRYYYYRLHPLTVKELNIQTAKDMKDLLFLGGFPEPFFSGSQREALRWRREYRSRVVHEDISSLELSQNLFEMEKLIVRLGDLVGSPLSINSLAKDFSLAHRTVGKYLDIFERMYLIYRISPFHSKKMRSVKKEKKHYHMNWADVASEGERFENLVAGHLLKWTHFQQDYHGKNVDLYYFRDTDKREVDFILTEDGQPLRAIECKLKSNEISPHLKYFKAKFPDTECLQVHLKKQKEYVSKEGIRSLGWRELLNNFI